VAEFVVNHVFYGKMWLPDDVDLQAIDWDELPHSQSGELEQGRAARFADNRDAGIHRSRLLRALDFSSARSHETRRSDTA